LWTGFWSCAPSLNMTLRAHSNSINVTLFALPVFSEETHYFVVANIWMYNRLSLYTWSSTYDRLPFWLTGRKSIWLYVGHIFINSIFKPF
jgi:hypothetical protein